MWEQEKSHESKSIGKKDLRQMQGHPPPRCGSRHLLEPQAQAASGIIDSVVARKV
jgi:hypothetical protein